MQLDPFQREAIDHLMAGRDVLVYAPTGSGKTRIAEEYARCLLSEGRGMVYTAPLKAISNQKYRDFTALFGEARVGLVTGDISINGHAPLVVMTTEIFRNRCLTEPETLQRVSCVVFDEIHYLGDEERGTVWEESVVFAPDHLVVLGLSATVSNAAELAAWMSEARGRQVQVVYEEKRPVPLEFRWILPSGQVVNERKARTFVEGLRPDRRHPGRYHRHQERGDAGGGRDGDPVPLAVMQALQADGGHFPVLYFVFSRRLAEEMAEEVAGEHDFLDPQERRLVGKTIREAREGSPGLFDLPNRRNLLRLLLRGVGYHHAGLAPQLKVLVETLYCQGLVQAVFCTETFAAGINYPAATAVFHTCRKWDGKSFRMLKAREFFQMAGRAGRRGFDPKGWVYVRVPACHPEETGFYREVALEPVESTLTITPATVLNMLRWGDAEVSRRFLDQSLLAFRSRHQKDVARQELTSLRRRLGKGELPRKEARQARNQVRRLDRRLQELERALGSPHRQFEDMVALLERLGYVEAGHLLEKGEFASRLRYQEILTTELAFARLLERYPAQEVAALLAGVDYEPGRYQAVQPIRLRVLERARILQTLLRRRGVPEAFSRWSPEPCALAFHWYGGADFSRLLELSTLQEGDIISILRREIDLLRQIEEAAAGSILAERARLIRLRLDRDEVQVLIG